MDDLLEKLVYNCDAEEQAVLIRQLKERGVNTAQILQQLLGVNPFLDLPSADRQALIELNRCTTTVNDLLLFRQIASKVGGRRLCVFCMPKSGSSFVQSALREALNIPFASLTLFVGAGAANTFKMNDREQELDEFAIVYTIFKAAGSFIAQHHTKASFYLMQQLLFYKIVPILTIRNIFDCIISADDMFVKWMEGVPVRSILHSPFSLPMDYQSIDKETRLMHLCCTFGIWLVNFFLSWKRVMADGKLRPLVISYEHDILTGNLTEKLTTYLGLNAQEQARLAQFVQSPDKAASRFNKGIAGRGALVPEKGKQLVRDYVNGFKNELSPQDYAYLVGTNEA